MAASELLPPKIEEGCVCDTEGRELWCATRIEKWAERALDVLCEVDSDPLFWELTLTQQQGNEAGNTNTVIYTTDAERKEEIGEEDRNTQIFMIDRDSVNVVMIVYLRNKVTDTLVSALSITVDVRTDRKSEIMFKVEPMSIETRQSFDLRQSGTEADGSGLAAKSRGCCQIFSIADTADIIRRLVGNNAGVISYLFTAKRHSIYPAEFVPNLSPANVDDYGFEYPVDPTNSMLVCDVLLTMNTQWEWYVARECVERNGMLTLHVFPGTTPLRMLGLAAHYGSTISNSEEREFTKSTTATTPKCAGRC